MASCKHTSNSYLFSRSQSKLTQTMFLLNGFELHALFLVFRTIIISKIPPPDLSWILEETVK